MTLKSANYDYLEFIIQNSQYNFCIHRSVILEFRQSTFEADNLLESIHMSFEVGRGTIAILNQK